MSINFIQFKILIKILFFMHNSGLFITQRQNRTAFIKNRPQISKFAPSQTIDVHSNLTSRPFTTSLGRTQALTYRNYKQAQQELNQTFKEDLSLYIRSKLKKQTKKHEQTIITDDDVGIDLNSTIINPQTQRKLQKNQPRNIRLMRICGLSYGSPKKTQKVVGEPYLVNTKQKLNRILSRKKQSQNQFENVNQIIKRKQIKTYLQKKERDKKFKNPEHVNKSQWDLQWRNDNEKETKRYRLRLQSKHKRRSNSLTIHW